MKVAFFSAKKYDRIFFEPLSKQHGHTLSYFSFHLNEQSAVACERHDVVCAFINDDLSAPVIRSLAKAGVKLIALRSAGFNHVDLQAAREHGIPVVRVPAYSPAAVAEHAVALLMTLNRKIHKAYARVKEGNFSIDGLLGFDVKGKTVGIIGTGEIGRCFARIMLGFGCKVVAFDPYPNNELEQSGVRYVDLSELYAESNIISLHCPLTRETHHLLNDDAFAQMPAGVVIVNTSRGKLIDTVALIKALKRGQIRALGLDVYEEEEDLFFEDLSESIIQDDVFARLLTFPNVIVTSHQAFLTDEALHNIAETTLANITAFETDGRVLNQVDIR